MHCVLIFITTSCQKHLTLTLVFTLECTTLMAIFSEYDMIITSNKNMNCDNTFKANLHLRFYVSKLNLLLKAINGHSFKSDYCGQSIKYL